MRYRQIHLDFHTSEHIPGVGSRFDPQTFARTIAEADVDSVTVFAKCHHGWSYHPTNVGKQHPNLDFDLTRAKVEALQKHNINTPIYVSAGWDELAAREHPEWRVVSPVGTMPRARAEPLGAGWAYLDFGTPYLDYLCRQIDEVMTLFPEGHGIFVDICSQLVSLGANAQQDMDELGLDWTDPDHCLAYTARIQERFYQRVRDTVTKNDPNSPLFFNCGHVRRGRRDMLVYYTHLEVESLPTAGWGYEHFPVSARYIEPLGIACLGMTGKFHHTWGEVGGYKKAEALTYECGAMLAHGARCSIGDHLHPTGATDTTTYRAVKAAYSYVKACEPWAQDSENVAEIGVFSVEGVSPPLLESDGGRRDVIDEGVVRILLESKFTFDVLDAESVLGRYKLLILPDAVDVSPELKERIDAFVAQGGRVLMTGQSGIDPERGFLFDIGADWHGPSPFRQGDYLLPIEPLRADCVDQPLFMYLSSQRMKSTDGVSLGDVHDPYFDRGPKHFSSHINTPSQPDPSGFEAGVEKGGFVYLAHPIFKAYHQVGAVAMLEIAEKAIARALGQPRTIVTSLPRAGRTTLRHQPRLNRYVLHLLYATPMLRGNVRGDYVEPIQDLVELSGVAVEVSVPEPIKDVRLVPIDRRLNFSSTDGRISFTVPEFTGHVAVEIAY